MDNKGRPMRIRIRNGEIVESGNGSRAQSRTQDGRESSRGSKRYVCPHCGVVLETDEPIEGTHAACPECGKMFVASPCSPGAVKDVKAPSVWKRVIGVVIAVVALLFILAKCPGEQSKSDGAKDAVKADIKAKVVRAFGDAPFGYDVKWVDDTLVVNLWADALTMGAVFAASGSSYFANVWNTVKSRMLVASSEYANISSTQGFEVHIMCNLLDSNDLGTSLLSILDGSVVYDATLR